MDLNFQVWKPHLMQARGKHMFTPPFIFVWKNMDPCEQGEYLLLAHTLVFTCQNMNPWKQGENHLLALFLKLVLEFRRSYEQGETYFSHCIKFLSPKLDAMWTRGIKSIFFYKVWKGFEGVSLQMGFELGIFYKYGEMLKGYEEW